MHFSGFIVIQLKKKKKERKEKESVTNVREKKVIFKTNEKNFKII